MVSKNQKYGKLTTCYVVGRKNRCKVWHCKCECENEINVQSTLLVSGNTKSCGCLKKESSQRHGEHVRKLNVYDLSGEYGIGYTSDGKEFYFDLEDYEKIKKYTWSINPDGYVISVPFGKPLRMYILIMGSDRTLDIDHKNHITYDNRKCNLRAIEHYQNITYSKTYSNNTSGRKGVYYDKNRNKWMACITFNKKTTYLGRFDTFDDAVKARENAERELHGEYHFEDN